MKILYVVPSLRQAGPVIVVKDLAMQMTKSGHQCEVVYFDDIVEVELCCDARHINYKDTFSFEGYDIVHSHGYRPDLFVAKNREHSGRVRYVATLHNYVLQDFRYQYNWFVAQICGRLWMYKLRNMDFVVALSNDAGRYYCRWFDPSKIRVAYNTRDIDMSHDLDEQQRLELLDFKGNSTLIGINALLTKRKGVDVIIKALPALPDYKLFVVGEGAQRVALEKLATKLQVIDRCKFVGYQLNAHRYLPYYDIYALPSRSEGFPLSLLEAAAYGRKCVASNLPIITETFAGAVGIFDINSPQSVVQTILDTAADDSLEGLINKRFHERYSPERLYGSYIKIYNENK